VIQGFIRFVRSFAVEILQLPQGTHNWSKFVTPEELALLMGKASLSVK
jgi:2-polyprenyl-3-methyl-5-hydroxy-6-metoxy-1,4-benzoquinol methylase